MWWRPAWGSNWSNLRCLPKIAGHLRRGRKNGKRAMGYMWVSFCFQPHLVFLNKYRYMCLYRQASPSLLELLESKRKRYQSATVQRAATLSAPYPCSVYISMQCCMYFPKRWCLSKTLLISSTCVKPVWMYIARSLGIISSWLTNWIHRVWSVY